MKAALIHSPPHGEVGFLNIGLAYVQGALERAGVETEVFDFSFEDDAAGVDFYDDFVLELSTRVGGDVGDGVDPRLLLEVVRPELFSKVSPLAATIARKADAAAARVSGSADVFLFSVNVLTQYFAAGLAARLRALGKRTAAGGPNLGFAPLRALLLRCGAFDAVAQGDGEELVAELVARLSEGREPELPGVSWLAPGDRLRQRPPLAPPPLASLARPSFRGMTVTHFAPILASRGCPRVCAFCSEPGKGPFRLRAVDDVLAEMGDWSSRGRAGANFHFHDDLINGSPAWVDRFCGSARGRGWTWESFCGPDGLTPARLEAMAGAGCVLLKLGVQSFSDRVLGAMRRKQSSAQLRRLVERGAAAGISMRFDLLTCFPGETDDEHRRTFLQAEELLAAAPTAHFSPNPFYLSLGSETHRRARAFGIELKLFDPETLPQSLRALVARSGAFPVGFRYGIPRETVRRRMGELGALLERHGKGYLYLGRTTRPDGRRRE